MWQWLLSPDVQHKECIKGKKNTGSWHQGTFWRERGTRSEMLIEKRRKSIKQACLIDSLPRCFLWRCQEQHNCSPSSSLSFSSPPTPPLSHPSLASSPIITLSSPPKRLTKLRQYLWLFRPLFLLFHYLSRNLPFSLLVVPSFSDGGQRCIHRQPFKAADWHSFNLVVL